jgi:preprotein translocase subunit SecD
MNRYPLWKNATIILVLLLAFLYTLPNFYGEVPAVQISSAKSTLKIDTNLQGQVEGILKSANIPYKSIQYENTLGGGTIRVKFQDTDLQIRAKDVIERDLNKEGTDTRFIVALSLLSASPAWLHQIRALPMYLGLDLRGGVHFLLEVDMEGALNKRLDRFVTDIKTTLKDQSVRHGGVLKNGKQIEIRFRELAVRDATINLLKNQIKDLSYTASDVGDSYRIIGVMTEFAQEKTKQDAVEQNMNTLHKRVNELAIAEPVIQKQGNDRIVVQLPGVQDTAKAKDILGRTATLEVRLVDPSDPAAEMVSDRSGEDSRRLPLKREVVLTGDNLNDAQAGVDHQTNEPAVFLTLDGAGSNVFRDVTRENIGKQMAILLVEKGVGEVVTAPVIRSEISGGRVQISGSMTVAEAADTALLLRSGSLAAPMNIIEERVVGPSLGAENIEKGLKSTVYGFLAIAVFMIAYYLLFGLFSVASLSINVLCLFALLSLLQATLTLPGIAAIALALGMAIDANVLINERIREELREGASPQAAIYTGYDRAWATILDSNVTTLIAGLALLIFGSGPIKGFAVVHCLGILTSMFSAVTVSRAMVNVWYGRRRHLKSVSIGQVWRG